jgi:hypothetical protein
MPGNVAGQVPPSWATPSVAEVGSVRLGRQRSPSKMSGRHATPYLRAGNIVETGLDLTDVLEMDFDSRERETYALREGDVVLAEASGSPRHVGRPAIWHGELALCCIQNTVIRFRPHAVRPEYALAVFRHYAASGLFARTARGSGLLHLGAGRFGDLPFPLPPMAEQQRIVAVLDAKLAELDQARTALESALGGTYEQDREILAAATTGRLTRNQADAQQTLPAAQGDLAGRHPVPAHWTWEPVAGVGDLTLGKGLGPNSRRGDHIRPYLRVANVQEDDIDLGDLKEMAFNTKEIEKYALKSGDVLLNDGQSPELVGRAAMYHGELPELCFQNHLIRFRASECVDPEFALLVFRHYLHAGEFRRLARGSTNIANLSRARLASMPFPVPPLEEQQRLAAEARRRLDASADQREAIVSSLAHAEEMGNELVAAAVVGQLVKQDPTDETAVELLERIGAPPVAPARAKVGTVGQKTRISPGPERKQPLELVSALVEAGRPLTLHELCLAAGVNVNEVGAIEQFYTTLRGELGKTIRVEGSGEGAELLAVTRAA